VSHAESIIAEDADQDSPGIADLNSETSEVATPASQFDSNQAAATLTVITTSLVYYFFGTQYTYEILQALGDLYKPQ